MNPRSSGSSLAVKGLLRLQPLNIVLVGPPGSGKSAVGRRLSERLDREFVDTDAIVEQMSGKPIPRIFGEDGEPAFRRMEAQACRQWADPAGRVIACGAGAILDPDNRRWLEAGGSLVGLTGEPEALLARVENDGPRPLLAGESPGELMRALLSSRRETYRSISIQIDTTALTAEQVAEQIAGLPLSGRTLRLTARRPLPGYDVLVGDGLLPDLAARLEHANLSPPYVVFSDTNVARHYGDVVRDALDCSLVTIRAGEQYKTLDAVSGMYRELLDAGLDRGGTVIALGGGVLTDLAGFASATYMRGVSWVALPTSLLGMLDASLGGKTGVNLQEGKNLIGALHAPGLVLADLSTLSTLAQAEIRAGLAEMIKAALIGDPDLFASLEAGPAWISRAWIQRAMQVKLSIVDEDPQERGKRAVLNLGHTFAHALETASLYRLHHGEAVAVGLVGATRLAQAMDLCQADLPDRVRHVLDRFGLPTSYSGLDREQILGAMKNDKKGRAGRVRFVLPVRPGQIEVGIEAPEAQVRQIIDELRGRV
jgi:3-dehydroquinate synthase